MARLYDFGAPAPEVRPSHSVIEFYVGSPVAISAGFECASNLIRAVFGFYDPVVIFPSFSNWKVAVGAE